MIKEVLLNALTIYTWIILITYILRMIPSTRYSAFTLVLFSGVEPYVNLFRGRFSRIGNFDLAIFYSYIAIMIMQQIIIKI